MGDGMSSEFREGKMSHSGHCAARNTVNGEVSKCRNNYGKTYEYLSKDGTIIIYSIGDKTA